MQLSTIIKEHTGRKFRKLEHYIDVYERYMESFRSKPITFLEIGVYDGGSLQLWKKYFHPDSKIYGVDINPDCKEYEEARIKILIGDQGDSKFLDELIEELPPIDIILDDGGHTMQQQILTFEKVFPKLKQHALYICEDCNTSYHPDYGGGLHKEGTFIEHMKSKIDELYAYNSLHNESFKITEVTKTAFGIHFYDSMVVIERKQLKPVGLTGPDSQRVPREKYMQHIVGKSMQKDPEKLKEGMMKNAIIEAINKNPIVMFNTLELQQAQKNQISNSIKEYQFSQNMLEADSKNSPKFKEFISEVRTFLTPHQRELLEKVLNNL